MHTMLSKIKIWKKYYVFYHHNLLYVIGLVFTRSLTNYSIIRIFMVYFTYYNGDLVGSAVLSNVHDSLSSIFVILMENIADSCVGRVRTVLFSNTAYIGGLWLLWMFNPYDVMWLAVITLFLIALGTSGTNMLDALFFDLVEKSESMKPLVEDFVESNRKKRSKARGVLWILIAKGFAAISAILLVAPIAFVRNYQSWRSTFLTCIIAMTLTLMIFCKGYNVYYQDELIERPITLFFRVCRDGIHKRLNWDCWSLVTASRNDPPSQNSESTATENEGTTQDAEVQHYRSSYHQKDLKVVVSLLRIFPVWAAYLVVSLISATGSTFFFEQYENLNYLTSIPLQIYSLIQSGSSFAILFLYRWASCSHKNEKVKIGVGMIFSIICCIMAWQLEVHRLKAVKNLDDLTTLTSISFLWLMPQFSMLGCMEGLTSDGLLNFFKSHINNKDLESYGEEYIELVLGFGKLLNIALILIFKSHLGWFSATINDSRLDKYYKMLVYVCSVNLLYYCVIAVFWFKDAKENKELINDDSQRLDP